MKAYKMYWTAHGCCFLSQRSNVVPKRIVHAHITLFEMWNEEVKKTDTHGQVVQFYLSLDVESQSRTDVESHHLCTVKTFSKPSPLRGSFQQAVAYKAGMLQSLLCCVAAKGIAMVTGTTFSFRTKSRQIQHLPKWFIFLSEIRKMSTHYSFAQRGLQEDMSKRDKGCCSSSRLEGV